MSDPRGRELRSHGTSAQVGIERKGCGNREEDRWGQGGERDGNR